MATPEGTCNLCGAYGKLSFEHVPPEAAFNHRPMIRGTIDGFLKNENDPNALDRIRGKQSQRGMGEYTLCPRCNNNTGAWYGNRYIDWAFQGMRHASNAKVAPSLAYTYQIFPLSVMKQIVCMFFSANGNRFHIGHPDLVKFVLDKRTRYLKPEVKIYAYFNTSARARQSGVVVSASFLPGVRPKVFSEISFPPFGYVMTINSDPPDHRMVDISFFSRYEKNQWCDVNLSLPILPIYSWVPGDYRSRDTVISDITKNIESGS